MKLEQLKESEFTPETIEQWIRTTLERANLQDASGFTINPDGTVDIYGSFIISGSL